jgi:hypothetical protein
MKPTEVRKWIGKRVEWDELIDIRRGTHVIREGVITDVKARNIEINGDWKWLSRLTNLRLSPNA